jgi:hypothetical protein
VQRGTGRPAARTATYLHDQNWQNSGYMANSQEWWGQTQGQHQASISPADLTLSSRQVCSAMHIAATRRRRSSRHRGTGEYTRASLRVDSVSVMSSTCGSACDFQRGQPAEAWCVNIAGHAAKDSICSPTLCEGSVRLQEYVLQRSILCVVL